MTDTPKPPSAPDPLSDLHEKLKLRKIFPQAQATETAHARESRMIFFDFVDAWTHPLQYLSEARKSLIHHVGDKYFSGRIIHDAAGQKIKLMLGFVEEGVELTPQNAGLILSAPISRVMDPEKNFLADFEKGQAQGLYTGLKEFEMMAAMRFAMDVEKLEGFSDRFPNVFTPVPSREGHFYEYINQWIVQQVAGAPTLAQALDIEL